MYKGPSKWIKNIHQISHGCKRKDLGHELDGWVYQLSVSRSGAMTSASCNASSFAAYQLQLLPLSQSAPKPQPQPTPTHLATFISSLRKPGAQFHLAQQQKTTLMLITWCCKEVATHAGNLHLFLTFPISIFFCFSLQICFLIFFFCFFFFLLTTKISSVMWRVSSCWRKWKAWKVSNGSSSSSTAKVKMPAYRD